MNKIRVMLVDDHLVVRKGLASLLEDEDDLTVVAEAGCGEEAIAQFAATKPDIAVLDLRLPDMSGIDVALALKEADPDAKLMILSSFRQEEDVHRAFEAGVLGYLRKTPAVLKSSRPFVKSPKVDVGSLHAFPSSSQNMPRKIISQNGKPKSLR